MQTGWIIECDCGEKIDDFSLCGEWFCNRCGQSGIFEEPEEEDKE